MQSLSSTLHVYSFYPKYLPKEQRQRQQMLSRYDVLRLSFGADVLVCVNVNVVVAVHQFARMSSFALF